MSHPHPMIAYLAHCALRTRALASTTPPITLGTITLLPHQTAAVGWILRRLTRFGGALLADPPGLGKTYVALAVAAAKHTNPVVIAPASLRNRWRDAASHTGIAIDFISTERLSATTTPPDVSAQLVMIDEAHHLRTPATRRHQHAVALCAHADVLLLTATPIHNRARDLERITSLFHLPATRQHTASLKQLTLRRTIQQLHAAGLTANETTCIPTIRTRRPLTPRARTTSLPEQLLAIPSLLPDGNDGHPLLQLGALHALRSSDAAAKSRLHHRIATLLAIEAAARAHILTTPAMRRAWQSLGNDTQLAMPQLLGSPSDTVDPALADRAAAQRRSIEAILPHLTGDGDRTRAAALRRLARWCQRPVVAFTQFSATAAALYHLLRYQKGIAYLDGTEARIASGRIRREEAIRRLLSTDRRDHQAVRLLITTDVLSEGLSLSGVALVVHLDLPWTAARLDQRIGRAARLGGPLRAVDVVTLAAPLPQAAHDALQQLLTQKRRHMTALDAAIETETETIHRLATAAHGACTRLDCLPKSQRWQTLVSPRVHQTLTIAIVRRHGRRTLVASDRHGVRSPTPADWNAACNSTVASNSRRGIARLRAALAAHDAEASFHETVDQPDDPRLLARRRADESLHTGGRSRRVHAATEVSSNRQTIMTVTRQAALSKLRLGHLETTPAEGMGPSSSRSSPTPRASIPRAHGDAATQSSSRQQLRIYAGVVIVPDPG